MQTHISEAKCLFCSLRCPVAVSLDAEQTAHPEYVDREDARLCFRGHYVAELLSHPARLSRPLERAKAGQRETDLRSAIALAVERMSAVAQPGQVGVVVDGNRSAESVAAALDFARDALGSPYGAVYLPPSDEELLRGAGMDAGALDPAELAQCDVILAIGDPFATHPVIAKPIIDAMQRERANRLAVIDCCRGRTARFATDFVQVPCGQEWQALEALASELNVAVPAEAGDPAVSADEQLKGRMAGVAAAVAAAEQLGIVISLPTGHSAHLVRVARLAAALHEARGGVFAPLYTYGAAASSWLVAQQQQALPMGSLCEAVRGGAVKALILYGVDLFSAVPSALALEAACSLPFLAVCSPLANRTSGKADVVFPAAFWFEESGSLATRNGDAQPLAALADPPPGVPTAAAFFEMLGEACAHAGFMASGTAEPAASIPRASEPRAEAETTDAFTLIARCDQFGFADGSLSPALAWVQATQADEGVQMNAHWSAELGLRSRDTVRITSAAGGEAELAVRIVDDLPPGVLAVCGSSASGRSLLDWSVDEQTGAIVAGPGRVSVTRAQS